VPTAAQAAAKANAEPGLCTKGTFSSMNRNSMVQHLDRESVTFDRYVSMDKLKLCHKEVLAAATALATAALVEVQPLLQEVYSPLPQPSGVNNSSQSVLPPPRQPLVNSSDLVAPTNIFEEVFLTFHDTSSAKHDMKSTLTSAIDDCGIIDSTKVICLLDPGMKLDVDVVLNCLKGAARVTLINML
jgi:hypothetical protein